MAKEEYRVERQLLTTRVFHGGQGRLDSAPELPTAAVEAAGVYQRWSESEGLGLDDAEVEVVYGSFTDEVQRFAGDRHPRLVDAAPLGDAVMSLESLGPPW